MFIAREPKTITAVLGTASTLLRASAHGMCRLIVVKPETGSTTYDLSIVDKYGYRFFEASDLTGEQTFAVDLPVFSYLTATISNASVDEDFDIMLATAEHYSL